MKDVDKLIQQHANQLLDESIGHIDPDSSYRLQMARASALQQAQIRRHRNKWYLPSVAASVVVAFIAVFFTLQPSLNMKQSGIGLGEDHMMSVEDSDETELYEDLEFYMWLSSKEWPS